VKFYTRPDAWIGVQDLSWTPVLIGIFAIFIVIVAAYGFERSVTPMFIEFRSHSVILCVPGGGEVVLLRPEQLR